MNTQKYLLPFALCLAGVAHHTSAIASGSGINPFQGFYGQIATGYESNSFSNTTTRYTNVSPIEIYSSGTNVASNQTASGMPLILGVGYNFSLNEKWILGVGADYSFLSQTTGKFSARNPAFALSVPAVGQQIQASNRINIFLTTGYALTQSDLVYAKAGYSNQQLQFSRPAQDSSTAYSLKSNQGGYVLGLGYRKTIQGGLYVYAEANYLHYSRNSMNGQLTTDTGSEVVTTEINQKPSASAFTALFGLGYRF
jgi:hypothetical protein